jgi:hypothetical protein
MRKWRLLLILGIVVGSLVWLAWPKRPISAPAPGQAAAAKPLDAVRPSSLLTGTASCAGRSCHGSLEPLNRTGSWQQEYTLWTSHDPHTRAYQILFDPPAKEMARRLGLPGANAHESALCLGCHVNPAAARTPTDATEAEFIRQERPYGVGCETCHGSAVHWLDAHLTSPWKTKNAEEKWRGHGLVPLGDAARQIQTCAGCHVGTPATAASPARDVNHDLLAAGHPRLMFEASSFLANLPAHGKPKPWNEVQRWAVGQAVSAEAALELLRHRVQTPAAPWPEFAEYDCTGCHHDLTGPSWRRGNGTWTWATWYLTLPRLLAGAELPRLASLANLLEKPSPSKLAVEQQIEPALAELKQLRERVAAWPDERDFAEQKMRWLLENPRLERAQNWDAAEQAYLALYALNQTAGNAGMGDRLRALLKERVWPPRLGFDPTIFVKGLP